MILSTLFAFLFSLISKAKANDFFIGDLVHIDYKILDNGKFTMTMEVKAEGFLAIGLGSSSMVGSNMFLGYFEDGKAVVQDRTSPNFHTPLLDENQEIENVSGFRNSSWSSYTFTRNLNKNGKPLFQLDTHTPLIYAYGNNDSFVFHYDRKGNTVVTFTKKNLVCDSSCRTCLGPLSTDCTSCNSGFSLINQQCFTSQVDIPQSFMKINDDFIVYFDFKDKENIDFVFRYPTTTFFGFGMGGYTMDEVDIIVCEYKNFQIQITDRYSSRSTYPPEDTDQGGTNDVFPLAATVITDPNTKKKYNLVKFTRKLNTGDTKDVILSQSTMKFSYAYLPENPDLGYHGPNRLSFNGDLIQGSQTTVSMQESGRAKRIKSHGLGQLVLWAILGDIIVIFTRFFRWKKYYMEIHLILFYILDVATLTLALLILIPDSDYYWTILQTNEKFLLHFILGISAMVLVVFQHLFGTILAFAIKSKKGSPFIQKLRVGHQLNGYLLLIVTKVVILLGYFSEDPNSDKWFSI